MRGNRVSDRARLAASLLLSPAILSAQDPSSESMSSACRTGASALADAYVRANPIYSYFFGELEPYVKNNRDHFGANGDSIRCAAGLSQAFLNSAVQLYDPDDLRRQQELNAELAAMGVSPGPAEPTASGQLFAVSMQLSRLARVLPPAAQGDFGPFWTPTTELEQMQLMAGKVWQMFLQDPSLREIMAQMDPMIRQLAELEHQFIRGAAERLANAGGG